MKPPHDRLRRPLPQEVPPAAWQREALRQQLLVRALWRDNTLPAIQGWLREDVARARRGLGAYAATGGASAERALAQAFPTVVALMGEESFGLMARAYRLAHAPRQGDLACLGEHLPAFIECEPQLADVPYLADVARLDALLEQAARAADLPPRPDTLRLLQQQDPQDVVLELAPGAALLDSRWPVVRIHEAHGPREAAPDEGGVPADRTDAAADAFVPARQALARGEAQCAWVWRRGFKPMAASLPPAQAGFMRALLQPCSLGEALARASTDFDFESWLLQALRQGWFLAVRPLAAQAG